MERILINNLIENESSRVSGMVKKVRNTKYMVFVVLQDRSGKIQVSIDKQNEELTNKALEITTGSIVSFEGKMVLSEYVKDGGKEFLPEDLEILSIADAYPMDENALPDTRMDYRWIDLRDDKKALSFKVQSEIVKYMRDYCYKLDFQEIHTPKLIGAASESGSNVFEVKYFDTKAYLAQSPQFYKQMAIASGIERVFEIAPVFRAENSNTNRHCTEFTSLDFEMAYIDSYNDVMKFEQDMLTDMLKNIKENYGEEIKEKYGVDVVVPEKDFPIVKLDDLYTELNKRYGYVIPEEDVGDLNAETEKLAYKYAMEEFGSEFIFVVGYPKTKRPFYHMRNEKGELQGYDLLWKGMEITSGSQREHRFEELQKNAIEKGLGKDVEFYLQFFKYGCAPHGGFAIGLERLTMLLLGIENIRDGQFIYRGPNRLYP